MPASIRLVPVTYSPISAEWFLRLRHFPNPVWLDSGHPYSNYGRFDILSAAPYVTFSTVGNITKITENGNVIVSTENPFDLLKTYLRFDQSSLSETPFCGGALGYFGYDLGRRLENLPNVATKDIQLPDMNVGVYPWAVIQDHHVKQSWLVVNSTISPAYNFLEIESICSRPTKYEMFHDLKWFLEKKTNSFKINGFESNLHAEKYFTLIGKIQEYISAGDCYQINLAQRFSAKCEGDPLFAYLRLRESLPSPYSAYLEIEDGAILSLSPERFIKLEGRHAETKPIKGTIARGQTPEEDLQRADELKSSLKDRAENLMIVDLLRNDLGKTCNDIKVPELFELQSFANVHHLVSTITGILKPEMTALDLLASSFPGGSITGAPKIRAMEIIEELEPVRRSVYCGSIGYISACGNMDTNIAIRTLLIDGNNIHCWGGGGIVADSKAQNEYEESIAKVKLLLETLEQNFPEHYREH